MRVLEEVKVVFATSEEHRVIRLLRLEVSNLRLRNVMFERFEVVLISLRILDQVLFYRIIFVLFTVVVTTEEGIEGETIILHAVAIAQVASGRVAMMVLMMSTPTTDALLSTGSTATTSRDMLVMTLLLLCISTGDNRA